MLSPGSASPIGMSSVSYKDISTDPHLGFQMLKKVHLEFFVFFRGFFVCLFGCFFGLLCWLVINLALPNDLVSCVVQL